MGISGLLQTLKSITHPVHVRDLEGLTVGVDAYCWLHRGAYSCSTEICRGEFTDKFVRFCMRRIELLLSHGVTPWVVFDGAPLPMKHGVNKARRDARAANLAKAEAAIAAGEPIAAQQHYARSVAVTHELARMFIRSLARRGIKFVVAPYEADAQLAFMSQQGLIDAIITEDSDCLPFCCKRMLFKLENDGSAQEIRARDLSSNENPSLAGWTYSMFLDMCLLAGCDYLPRVHGLGIGTAHKLVARHRSHKPMLAALRASRKFALPDDFEDRFEMARLTFRHQRVYDPRSRCVVPLMPLPPSARERQNLDFLGPELPPHIAEAIANSTMDPYTREPYLDALPEPLRSAADAAPAARAAPVNQMARGEDTAAACDAMQGVEGGEACAAEPGWRGNREGGEGGESAAAGAAALEADALQQRSSAGTGSSHDPGSGPERSRFFGAAHGGTGRGTCDGAGDRVDGSRNGDGGGERSAAHDGGSGQEPQSGHRQADSDSARAEQHADDTAVFRPAWSSVRRSSGGATAASAAAAATGTSAQEAGKSDAAGGGEGSRKVASNPATKSQRLLQSQLFSFGIPAASVSVRRGGDRARAAAAVAVPPPQQQQAAAARGRRQPPDSAGSGAAGTAHVRQQQQQQHGSAETQLAAAQHLSRCVPLAAQHFACTTVSDMLQTVQRRRLGRTGSAGSGGSGSGSAAAGAAEPGSSELQWLWDARREDRGLLEGTQLGDDSVLNLAPPAPPSRGGAALASDAAPPPAQHEQQQRPAGHVDDMGLGSQREQQPSDAAPQLHALPWIVSPLTSAERGNTPKGSAAANGGGGGSGGGLSKFRAGAPPLALSPLQSRNRLALASGDARHTYAYTEPAPLLASISSSSSISAPAVTPPWLWPADCGAGRRGGGGGGAVAGLPLLHSLSDGALHGDDVENRGLKRSRAEQRWDARLATGSQDSSYGYGKTPWY